ncbi:hypothetical protein VOLCADRAFT_87485 [Volvox carteri f. nagariensis]|uniref:Glycosyl transferase CAP10 domain-containing protein n=1 Tax=Volvox carteri f. nagariensis TaxID=3068 RepID=D8TLG5_VOLCA|nr:uncharacterized protein VOLCADRAFT_87485 [Volvox carteri f. nagariensis]EFJ51729.1 hypothetical protein VOLCADRAFT_87485 [Volvox carteri f. nagariensis]|eukprot:XP_002947139.1 hypothetical protein VOLCADRAFT_87485 [Volvox carteri f. nagariensis]
MGAVSVSDVHVLRSSERTADVNGEPATRATQLGCYSELRTPAVRTPAHIAEALGNATLRALYPNHSWNLPVVPSDTPRGPTRVEQPHVPFIAVQTDEDQVQLYDENLERDLAPWRRRNRSEMTVSALLQWAARLPNLASQRVVMIKGGRLALLQQKNGRLLSCERPCDVVLDELLKDLRSWISTSPSDWPDVVFFLNAADTSLCQQQHPERHDQEGTQQQQQQQEEEELAPVGGDGDGGATAATDDWSSSSSSNSSGRSSGEGEGRGHGLVSEGGRSRRRRQRRQRSKAAIGRCPVPVLSVIKEWDRHKDEDILVPVTVGMHGWAPLHYFPWDRKIERAVFRGREYCHTRVYPYAPGVCSRTYMAFMTQYNPEWAPFVDVGLLDNYTLHLANRTAVQITGRGFVRVSELYLLALDGITASYRLGHLLSLNSVVLKQWGSCLHGIDAGLITRGWGAGGGLSRTPSPWIEWYYRSLVPGTHYVSIWNYHRSDVLNVIKSLRHKRRYLYDIATHGQAFAYRYLAPHARRLYWMRVLREYRQLFGDMEEFVAAQEIPETEPEGPGGPSAK